MRPLPRTAFRSTFWAYLACFIAGGATVGLASYAYQQKGRGHGPVVSWHGLHALHRVVFSRADTASVHAGVVAPAPSKAREAIVLARVEPAEPKPNMPEPAVAADADLDAGLSDKPWEPNRNDTYRTVCVRLCDGSFTPMSFATTKARLKADSVKCQASCGSPARLFYAPAGSGELEEMVDLNGEGYVDLPNAFKFRTSYDASCTCRAQPWEEASLLRHRRFAAAAARDQANQSHASHVVLSGVPREVVERSVSTSRRAELPSSSRPLVTGAVRRSLPAEVAESADLPPAVGDRSVTMVAPSAVQADAKDDHAGLAAAKGGDKGNAKGLKARTVASRGKRHMDQVELRAAAPGSVFGATRDLRMNVRGSVRAQRQFDSQDFWRVTFWEPH